VCAAVHWLLAVGESEGCLLIVYFFAATCAGGSRREKDLVLCS